MLKLFYNLYNSTTNRSQILEKSKILSAIRFVIRLLSNAFIRIKDLTSFSFPCLVSSNSKPEIIVSLTTFPKRIKSIHLVIETILLQTYKPDKIILWLSEEQFTDISILPKKLLKLRKYGLEIFICEGDIKSHKKYLYAMKEYPESIIITVDDDVLYHPQTIENLVNLHKQHPNTVCCNNAVYIGVDNGKILPYLNWNNVINDSNPSYSIFPVGIGGVLYPPRAMHSDVTNIELAKKLCFYADDIWLNAMSRIAGTKSVSSCFYQNNLPIIIRKNETLTAINVNENQNDAQLKLLRDYYIAKQNLDPYKHLIH